MNDASSAPETDVEQKIAALTRTLRAVEKELQVLTGGRPDFSPAESGGSRLLRASEEQFSNAFEHAAIGVALVSLDGHWLKINASLCQLLGYSVEELMGHTFQEITHPDDLQTDLENVGRLLVGEIRFYHMEKRYFHKQGHVLWVLLSVSLLRDAAGQPLHFIAQVQDITERKSTEQTLRKNEALLRIAGRVARLGGWTIQLPEYTLTWSDEICAIHEAPPGYTPTLEEGIQLFPPEARAEVIRLVKECEEHGTPYDIEVPKLTVKGRQIWVRSIGEAVRNSDGKIIRLQGAFQDITERRKVEVEMARLNRALRMLSACHEALIKAVDEPQLLAEICRLAVEIGHYRMAWVGYAVPDPDCSITPMACAGEGSEFLGKIKPTWSDKNATGQGPAGRAIRSGQAVVCEDITQTSVVFNWRDEALAYGFRSVIALPLRDENRTFGLLCLYSGEVSQPGADELKLLQDLADDLAFGIGNLRARAERQVAQQKIAQQAALLDQATDAIMVRDLEHRVTFWSKSAERIYGWSATEVISRSTLEFLFVDPKGFGEAMRHLLQHGKWVGELQKKTKAGQIIHMDCRWTLVRDDANRPASILAIETDITEKKRLEAQFLRAQRMESIGTLAGGIAHDLNNMLAPILISVELLNMKFPDAEAAEILRTIQASAQRGSELVRQVLSFARGVEGQRIDVNPIYLIREIQKIVRDTFPKSINFDFEAQKNLWFITGDLTQLHQVFLNLCLNARDAMPAGGRLTVTMENVVLDETYAAMNPGSFPGTFVVIQVADTGSGIPPEIRDRIYEPFFTTKEIGKGTGLGLSTTLAIIKSHGGFINLCSEAGKGAIFKVYLPAKTTAVAADHPVAESLGPPRGNGELVLIVDDEEAIRKIAQRTLERFGYRVVTARNGAEAVSLYAQQSGEIAVVLTDMAMPIMDGPALIIALKSMNPEVRIIGSSGLASHGGVAKAIGAGLNHFLPKPYTTEILLKTLRKALTS